MENDLTEFIKLVDRYNDTLDPALLEEINNLVESLKQNYSESEPTL